MFLHETDSSEWMFSSQLWSWVKNSLPPNPKRTYLALYIQICSQVQNFAELVPESWLALAILAKALQKHYVNTFTPAGGENAACGCMARSCCASAACCNFLSLDLYLAPSWTTADCFPPRGKVLWITFQSLMGGCPQGNFCGTMNVPPAVPLHSFCCCSRCEVIQGCLN